MYIKLFTKCMTSSTYLFLAGIMRKLRAQQQNTPTSCEFYALFLQFSKINFGYTQFMAGTFTKNLCG